MKLLKPKYRRLMRALAIPAILIFLLSVIAMVTGRMALSYEGIAADDAGRLYLGRGGKIEVYEAGQKVSAITPHVDKSFLFTVRDGQLLLSTGTYKRLFPVSYSGGVSSRSPGCGLWCE